MNVECWTVDGGVVVVSIVRFGLCVLCMCSGAVCSVAKCELIGDR